MLDKILKVLLIGLAAYLIIRVGLGLYRRWKAHKATGADGATVAAGNAEPENAPLRSAQDGGPTFGGDPAIGVTGSRYGGYGESGYGMAYGVMVARPTSGVRTSYEADARQYYLRRV